MYKIYSDINSEIKYSIDIPYNIKLKYKYNLIKYNKIFNKFYNYRFTKNLFIKFSKNKEFFSSKIFTINNIIFYKRLLNKFDNSLKVQTTNQFLFNYSFHTIRLKIRIIV